MYEELWCVRYYDEHDDEFEVFYRGESLGKVTHHRTESYKYFDNEIEARAFFRECADNKVSASLLKETIR